MKKLILIFMFTAIAFVGHSQVNYPFPADTLKAADTVYLEYPTTISANYVHGLGFTVTEKAGTPTVVARQQGMIETGKWLDLGADTVIVTTAGAPDVASHKFTGDHMPYLKYRVRLEHSGTTTGDTTIVSGRLVLKRW